MSHLSTVHSHKTQPGKAPRVELSADEEDTFTTSDYGSRFACMELPRHQLPNSEMPRDIAYRLIKDELSLDNNPALKYVVICLVCLLQFR
jgi:glutamate decarboxylase